MSNTNVASSAEDGRVYDGDASDFHALDEPALASDLLRGVREIAFYVYGTCDRGAIRSIYHLTSSEKNRRFPTFKKGGMTCAYKSSIRAHIWMQQRCAWPERTEEYLVRLHILLSGILTLLSERNAHIPAGQDEARLRALVTEGVMTISRIIHIDTDDDDPRGIGEAGR
jgi:hypothetical protein